MWSKGELVWISLWNEAFAYLHKLIHTFRRKFTLCPHGSAHRTNRVGQINFGWRFIIQILMQSFLIIKFKINL